MSVRFVLALSAISFGVLSASTIQRGQSVVGCRWQDLRRGSARIVVDMEPLCLFPTLAKVIQFSPPEGILGDSIEFDLDGRHQRYTVVAFTNGVHVLRSSQKGVPRETTFEGIPLLPVFLFHHQSTNSVHVNICGEAVAGEKVGGGGARGGGEGRGILIRYVSPADGQLRTLATP